LGLTPWFVCLIQGMWVRADAGGDRSPRSAKPMPNGTGHPPAMREGDCPYCERTVLVYEEPPRCPLCDCPLEEHGMRPFSFPVEPDSIDTDRD
jgi:hypothetical protein